MITAMCWDKYHQMTFPLKNFLCISIKHEISAVVHSNESLQTNKQANKHHRTDWLRIARPLELPATCHDMQQNVFWVGRASWKWLFPFWPVAYNIILSTFHFSLSSSTPFQRQQVMAPQTPQPGVIQSELSQTPGDSLNAPQGENQQLPRCQVVHRTAAIAVTKNMAQDAHFKTSMSIRMQQW
jgi:hypothetical protein